MLETSLRFSFFLWFCIQSVRKLCWPYSQNISRVRFLLTTTHIWAKTTFFFIYGENYSVRTSVRSYYSAQNTTQDLHFTQCISLSYTDGPLRFHTIQLPLFFISYLNSLFFSCSHFSHIGFPAFPQTCQLHSCLRVFALALLFAWSDRSQNIHIEKVLTSFSCWSDIITWGQGT